MNNELRDICKYLHENDVFLVTSHVSADGDNIGSSHAMVRSLKLLGKEVYYVFDDNIPHNLKFAAEGVEHYRSGDINLRGYTLMAFDCGDDNRVCVDREIIINADMVINIDHHRTNDLYGGMNFVDPEASSTCEIVYNLLKTYSQNYNENVFNEEIATLLYLGIVTDTGNFQYASSGPSTLRAGADLIELGARKQEVVVRIFQSDEIGYLRLLGEVLSSIEIIDSIASLCVVDIDLLTKYNVSYDQIEGIASYTRNINGIELGALLKERKKGEFKVSLRSKSYINVSEIAKSFGGGGHKNAAGLTLYGTKEECIAKMRAAIEEAISNG